MPFVAVSARARERGGSSFGFRILREDTSLRCLECPRRLEPLVPEFRSVLGGGGDF